MKRFDFSIRYSKHKIDISAGTHNVKNGTMRYFMTMMAAFLRISWINYFSSVSSTKCNRIG